MLSESIKAQINKSYLQYTREIIGYNKGVLRGMPGDYREIMNLLLWNSERFKYFLMDLYADLYSRPAQRILWHDCYMLTGSHILKKYDVGRLQYLNYAACVGLIDKVNPGYIATENEPHEMTFANDNYEKGQDFSVNMGSYQGHIDKSAAILNAPYKDENGNTWRKNPTFIALVKLTPARRELINQKIAELRRHNITPANMTYDRLIVAGMEHDAMKVLFQKTTNTYDEKLDLWRRVTFEIDCLIAEKGYCRKDEVKKNVYCSWKQFKDIFSMFLKGSDYYYHRPSQKEKKIFGLENDTFIITQKSA